MIRHRKRRYGIPGAIALLLLGALGNAPAQARTPAVPSAIDTPAPTSTSVPQLGAADATVRAATESQAGASATARDVCGTGATWLRLRFTELDLRGDDTLTVTGAAGGGIRFKGGAWRGRAFSTRALPGACARVEPHFADPGSRYALDGLQAGTRPLAEETVVVAGAGDICGSACASTASVVSSVNPAAVLTFGDNAYDSGTLGEYTSKYHPTWGAFLNKTYPTPGNHEYNTSGAAGYFDYFKARAGERGKGYYSWDIGDWHFVALNSNISMSAGSAQEQWLRQDLAANTKPCTAAYLHHPLYNVGNHGPATSTRPLWKALYDHKADLMLAGHDHNYQRWALQDHQGNADAAGVREILVGTGGKSFYGIGSGNAANLQVKNDNTHGVLKLTLTSTGYTFDFVPISGRTFTDRGSATCHNATTTADFGLSADPAALSVAPGASGTSTVRVASLNGFTAETRLAVTGQPAGVTATISPQAVTPAAGGTASATLQVSTTSGARPGTYPLTVTGTSGTLSHTTTVQLTVTGGPAVFADDFESDRGWTVNASGTDSATTGRWERGDPEETSEQGVKQLGTTVSGTNALVTGRLAGSGPGSYDVDGGLTSVRSPAITLPSGRPTLAFSYNFAHRDNSGPDDFLRVKVVGGSTTTTVLEKLGTAGTDKDGAWTAATADLSAFAGQTVRILVEAADNGTASLVEAAIDDVSVTSAGG